MPFYLTLLIAILLIATPLWLSANPSPQLMLAKTRMLDNLPRNTSGFYVSEKYDGVRAYWTGREFLTRQGNHIAAPDWFIQELPSFALDGELWIERNRFDDVSAAIRKSQPVDSEWQQIKFMVFDIPVKGLAFYQRKEKLDAFFKLPQPNWLQQVDHLVFDLHTDLLKHFNDLVQNSAEGIMLNVGNATYKAGRSNGLFKVKPLYDAEAIVTAYQPGKGKYKGMMGALWVKNNKGQSFKIGSGFSDLQRRNPPKIGAIISYEYSGLSKTGLPRFARFSKVRTDL